MKMMSIRIAGMILELGFHRSDLSQRVLVEVRKWSSNQYFPIALKRQGFGTARERSKKHRLQPLKIYSSSLWWLYECRGPVGA